MCSLRSARCLGCVLALPIFMFSIGCQTAAPRPHVVLFLADDLGWQDVGFHGSEIETPHLDQLARDGARLEQFYVQPVCSPTRSSLMTGRYPIRQGLQVGVIWPWADFGLPLEERTLPEALGDVGYRTAIVGKWHLGCHEPAYLPRARGFDHQYGHYLGAIDYYSHERMGGLDWHRNGRALREEGYTTNLIGDEAVDVITNHDASTPLFLYVPFNAPHTPLQAPQEYIDRYAHIEDERRRKYAAMVTCMDVAIGRIVDALEHRHMRENTLILFASDNGGPVKNGANNGPWRGGKGSIYEGGVRVPALAVWDGKIGEGLVVDELLHIVDWYPTILRLAGASLSESLPLDGRDAWATIARAAPSPRDEVLHNHSPTESAIRVGQYKLVVNQSAGTHRRRESHATIELFDISTDPYEQHDLANQQPDKVRELQARLQTYADVAEPAKGMSRGRIPKDFVTPAVWGESTPH